MVLFFDLVSSFILWAAFWAPPKKELLKLESNFDLVLGSSWVGLGTILGNFWSDFLNFLSTCLRSRFDIDFCCFFDALQTLIFLLSPRRELNFDIFAGVDVGIDFDFQNLPKIEPKPVPRGLQNDFKHLLKNRCNSAGRKTTKKVNEEHQVKQN